MPPSRAPLASTATACLLALLVSGCSQPAATLPEGGTPPTGAGAGGNITLAAPTWHKGDYWDHQWDLYSNGTVILSIIVRVVVAEAGPGSYLLGTDNSTMAAFHGAFGFPTLGRMSSEGDGLWSMKAGPGQWSWYPFPLSPGKAWEADHRNKDGSGNLESYKVQGKVISTTKDAATLEMRSDGKLLATYDYDVGAGWFSDMKLMDPNGQPSFRIQRLASGHGYSGPAYIAEGHVAASTVSIVSPFFLDPHPATDFPIEANATQVLAFVFPIAATGAATASLVAPDGSHYDASAADINGIGILSQALQVFVPAQPGTWRFATGGAGLVAGGGILAYSITEQVIQV